MQPDDFATRPWCDLSEADFGPASAVPTMLNLEERQFYVWLARRMAHVPGAIVDLGCFAGGSSAHLAEGNRQGGGTAPVFAYDNFTATRKSKQNQLYPKGIAPFDGSDMLPLSQRLLAPWPNVTPRKGRIEDSVWTDGPISLLVQDASKTDETMDQMAEIFFPHLVAGQSLIVQQDELHWKEPWVAVQMERLQTWFAPLCFVPGGMMIYLCTQTPTTEMLAQNRVTGMTDEAMIAALTASARRLSGFGVDHKLKRQIAAIRTNPGIRKSWSFANRAPAS